MCDMINIHVYTIHLCILFIQGESYRRIVYLRYLVSNFDHSVWFIQHCTTAVISLLEVLPNNEDMVTREVRCSNIRCTIEIKGSKLLRKM